MAYLGMVIKLVFYFIVHGYVFTEFKETVGWVFEPVVDCLQCALLAFLYKAVEVIHI